MVGHILLKLLRLLMIKVSLIVVTTHRSTLGYHKIVDSIIVHRLSLIKFIGLLILLICGKGNHVLVNVSALMTVYGCRIVLLPIVIRNKIFQVFL